VKILPFQIPKPTNDALIYQEDHELEFYNQLHQHEEIQLSFIAQGEGTLLVGDSLTSYSKGDVFAIDSNLPHVFLSAKEATSKSLMLSLFFTRNSFGKGFFELEETHETRDFFDGLKNGFKIEASKEEVSDLFLNLKHQSKMQRFIALLEIVRRMSHAKKSILSSQIFEKRFSANEGKRMRDVMDFTLHNFNKDIRTETIADIAYMTPNAFCKYFKKRTNKTYNQFLNEIRIEKACQLLNGTDGLIAEIGFATGFRNLSNFNRKFKEIKGLTPSAYRAQH
tara:strand:+ start:81227 stop:82066 length:840 start_codon:yes stop_codon:yes gene_type:complete